MIKFQISKIANDKATFTQGGAQNKVIRMLADTFLHNETIGILLGNTDKIIKHIKTLYSLCENATSELEFDDSIIYIPSERFLAISQTESANVLTNEFGYKLKSKHQL